MDINQAGVRFLCVCTKYDYGQPHEVSYTSRYRHLNEATTEEEKEKVHTVKILLHKPQAQAVLDTQCLVLMSWRLFLQMMPSRCPHQMALVVLSPYEYLRNEHTLKAQQQKARTYERHFRSFTKRQCGCMSSEAIALSTDFKHGDRHIQQHQEHDIKKRARRNAAGAKLDAVVPQLTLEDLTKLCAPEIDLQMRWRCILVGAGGCNCLVFALVNGALPITVSQTQVWLWPTT
ncbi:hypothetical protein BDR03DRAFT_987633 [Suillus americanus]|nr:hypothetical protein BDR03DRAFT_987633 [Suillus americanus]